MTHRKRQDARILTFLADGEVLDALARLEEAADPTIMRGRSAIIRRALLDAADKLDDGADDKGGGR